MTKYNIIVIIIVVWEISYYESPDGKHPVKDYIDSLDAKSQAKVARTIDLLEEFGIKLGMPYAKEEIT
ncbi:MAG: hypothetical protein AB1597_04810 [Chloroflexota bacterium]